MAELSTTGDAALEQPTLLTAGLRYRWLVAVSLALGSILAFAYTTVRQETYDATAELFVQDPQVSGFFETGASIRSERYLLNQLEFLRSTIVAQRAVDLLPTVAPEVELTADELQEDAVINGQSETDRISVTYRSEDRLTAQAGANALARAYQDLRQEVTSAS